MKISLDWLREYADFSEPVETLAQALIDTGTEVDRVERRVSGVIVARVMGLSPVPESSKGMRFADIDIGGPENIRVITGAPNVEAGDLVPYAAPGAKLVDRDELLESRSMFGGKYHSPGMLCSAIELGVGDDADGLLKLQTGTPGEPIHALLPVDHIFEVEVTTNRPDCLCHLGIAREMAAALGKTAALPADCLELAPNRRDGGSAPVKISIEDSGSCPRFSVAVIEGCKVAPSPAWLQKRLEAIGLRPINNVVDVTNYVLHEVGEPLHAFDLDAFLGVQGNQDSAEVTIRRGSGEEIACLDGKVYRATAEDVVVCAGKTPVSFAGIIGGTSSAVADGTTRVLLEAATWEPTRIRASSKRLGVRTDASSLFEKGLSDTLPPVALARAAKLIAELTGGAVAGEVSDAWPQPLPAIAAIKVDLQKASQLLGYDVTPAEASAVLQRLDFTVETAADATLVVVPPHFRRDVSIFEDIVEEVGRCLGYSRVPSTLPGRRMPVSELAPDYPLEERCRDLLVGAGCDEAITWSFVSPDLAQTLPGLGGSRSPIPIPNALSDEWSVLRTSILPGLCHSLAYNLNQGLDDVGLFEIGRVFWEGERAGLAWGSAPSGQTKNDPPLPAEPLLLAVALSAHDGQQAATHIRGLQSIANRLTQDVVGRQPRTVTETVAEFRPGRMAKLSWGDKAFGIVGELTGAVVQKLELRGRIVVMELRLDVLSAEAPRALRFRQVPRFPAVVQDLAVVVSNQALAAEGIGAVREGGGALLENVELYDEFRDPARIGEDRKGWTFRLTYRASDRTLTNEEVQRVQEAVGLALRVRCGAEVRK